MENYKHYLISFAATALGVFLVMIGVNNALIASAEVFSLLVATMGGLIFTWGVFSLTVNPVGLGNMVSTLVSSSPRLLLAIIILTIAALIMGSLISAIALPQVFLGLLLGEEILSNVSEAQMVTVQLLVVVALSGLLGGVLRHFYFQQSINGKSDDHHLHAMAVLQSTFAALIAFFIFRAGIIHQVTIDTFNVFGVAGMGAVVGFFSDDIIEKFKGFYNRAIEEES